jgi:hypothetical protein
MNVTVVLPTSASFLTVFPSDDARPLTANLNWVAGQAPTPNAVTVALSSTGSVSFYNLSGTVHLTADIVGYYEPAISGTGPAGPAGPTGPAGPPGISGFEIVSSDRMFAAGTTSFFGGHTATCPAGKKVLDGGVHALVVGPVNGGVPAAGSTSAMDVRSFGPNAAGTAYSVSVDARPNSTFVGFRVTAICTFVS